MPLMRSVSIGDWAGCWTAGVLAWKPTLLASRFTGRTDVGGGGVLAREPGNLLFGIPIGGQKGVEFIPARQSDWWLAQRRCVSSDALSLDNSKFAWDFGGGAMFYR